MGIVNMTPDSFYDGGKYDDTQSALRRIASLLEDGADMIDVGARIHKAGFLGSERRRGTRESHARNRSGFPGI